MSNDFQINISGIDQVCENLDRLPVRLVKNAYAKALVAGALPIVQALEARMGFFKEATGDLETHLVTDVAIDSAGKGGRIQIGFGKLGHVARFVEYGHRDIGHKPLSKELGIVQPHPFMRPALETAADAAVDAFATSIKESIDEGLV
jgi:HK97 gp10 family phage protein